MDNKNCIVVTKTAETKVAANRVCIAVTASGEAKKYSAAIDAADSVAQGFVQAFSRSGVGLSGGGINVHAVRRDNKISGYRATKSYSAEFDFDQSVLKAALDILAELAVEWNVSFTFKDGGERADLISQAVRAARCDAESIAAAAGVRVGKLDGVEYAPTGGAHPMLMRAAAYDGSTLPERITLSETVTCAWQIEN